MVFNLKILFFSLISFCYLNTVFEISDNEEKQNFEKESHCYTYQETLKLNFSETTTQNKVVVVEADYQFQIVHYPVIVSKITPTNYQNKLFKPPEKRYILYSSLLI